mgnify:CR=1 FL=1
MRVCYTSLDVHIGLEVGRRTLDPSQRLPADNLVPGPDHAMACAAFGTNDEVGAFAAEGHTDC